MKSSSSSVACSAGSASAAEPHCQEPAPPTSAKESSNTTSHTDEASGIGSSWGLSSTGLPAALYSGMGGLALALADDQDVSSSSRKDHRYQDEEWERSAREVEDAAARAAAAVSNFFGGGSLTTEDAAPIGDDNALESNANEGAAAEEWGVEQEVDGDYLIEDTARVAAAAASSFLSGASTFLAGAVAEAEGNNYVTRNHPVDDRNNNQTEQEPDALRSILNLNPLNSIASHWIDDLEQQSALADPHHRLRRHLDDHLGDWPASTYEEWVEEALVGLDRWDRGSAVVDDTFYRERSVHRNLWNEKMGAGENKIDGIITDRNKRYVLPRKPPVAAASGSTASVAIKRNETLLPPNERVTATSSVPTSVDADLDNLISERGIDEVQTIPTTDPAPKTSNDYTDMNELLVEEEAVFVSPPNSGGFHSIQGN